MTDTLYHLFKSDQMSDHDREQAAQGVLDSIDAFAPLRHARPDEAAQDILIHIDAAVREHKRRPVTHAYEITCLKGCAHCCAIPVVGTIPEAVYALAHAESIGFSIDEAKLARQARYDRGIWFEQPKEDQACVFMTAERTCAIYEARPASCRKHFSQGDPEDCNIDTRGVGGAMKRWVVPLAEILYSGFMNVFRPGPWPKVLAIALARRRKGGTA